MGKRDDKNKVKLCLLRKIKEKRKTLFGAFGSKLSKEEKINAWKEINVYGQSIGLVHENKAWTYIRDVWWPNVRKATTVNISFLNNITKLS